jgi:nicotinate-nucleotide adenylyltransferase
MRIGVYGGTFSPPHNGHVAAAKAFMEQMWLDVLFIIPAYLPPHKEIEGVVTPNDRLLMCERAFSHLDGVIVSDLEFRRKGTSYTVDTLREIAARTDADSRIFLLMGTDMLLTLDRWYCPDEIFRLSYPVYMRREEQDPILDQRIVSQIALLRNNYGKVVRRITGDVLPISGAQIRALRKEGKQIDSLVPESVASYIYDHNLYV